MLLSGSNLKAMKAWRKKNAEAQAEIVLHIEVSQLAHVCDENSKDIWNNLETMHCSCGLASHLTLHHHFLTMHKRVDQPMANWIAFQLREISITVDNEDLILILTMGLPKSYDTFIISLYTINTTTLILNLIITHLLNKQSRQSGSNLSHPSPDPGLTAATLISSGKPGSHTGFQAHSNLTHITCYKCGQKGHFQANCPNPPPKPLPSEQSANAAFDHDDFLDEISGTW
jgi:gag-polypeptide of LTR copia-type/Zinc knuckle